MEYHIIIIVCSVVPYYTIIWYHCTNNNYNMVLLENGHNKDKPGTQEKEHVAKRH